VEVGTIKAGGNQNMKKIAFATDDGETIGQHFGQTKLYTVVTLDEGGQAKFEQRPKWHHGMEGNNGQEHSHGEHSHGEGSHNRSHQSMFEPVQDCQVLVVGGMGQPAYESARAAGLEVILTGEKQIRAAVEAYQAGRLQTDERRIHRHRH
jgi:predicted Fe-Mo cluster-binding NifX family protein